MKNQQPKIELRKDVPRPYWRLRLFVPTPTGLRRRNFDLGFRDETTRKQANKQRLELLAKVNKGELHDSGGMKFSDLVARFRELRLPSLKARSATRSDLPWRTPSPSGQHHKWDKLFLRVKPAAKHPK